MKRILYLFLTLAALSSHAQWTNGNNLHEQLSSDENSLMRALGIGYVIGVAESWDGIVFCTPGNSTPRQLSDTVKVYLANNPSQRHKPGRELVNSALRSAFPCLKK